MKRLLCCFFVLGAAFVGKGQDTLKPLLRKEVFDFQVGDVFQYEHITERFFPGASKKIYTYSQVITLSKKIVKDTIFYENEVKEKDLLGNIEIHFSTDTILYKDSSIFYGLPSYIPNGEENKFREQNTIYYQNNYGYGSLCQNWVKEKASLNESLSYLRRYMKGLGLVYWRYDNYSYPIDGKGEIYTSNIVYYKKENKTYGKQVDFITALNDSPKGLSFSIYPNPASEVLYIRGLTEYCDNVYYEISDMYGKKIKHGNMLSDSNIEIVDMPNGLYIIYIFNKTNKLLIFQQKVIIH